MERLVGRCARLLRDHAPTAGRANGVCRGDRGGTQLGGLDGANATFAVPGWPFGPEGGLLLVNDGAGAPLELQVRPKDSFECRFDPTTGYYLLRGKGANAQRLHLKISRVGASAGAAARPAVATVNRPKPRRESRESSTRPG